MIPEKSISATAETVSLSALASQINEQHSQATRHATTATEHARQAGVLLQQAKQQVGHGDWLPWLASNCSVSPRQAQRYLKVANNWQAITKNDATSYLTIDDAIALTQQSDCPVEARLYALGLIRSVIDELKQKLASTNDIGELTELQKLATECQLLASRIRLDFERVAGALLTAGQIGGAE